jgi:hypothetical protein
MPQHKSCETYRIWACFIAKEEISRSKEFKTLVNERKAIAFDEEVIADRDISVQDDGGHHDEKVDSEMEVHVDGGL